LATCRSRPATLTPPSLPGARNRAHRIPVRSTWRCSGLTWTSFNWTSTFATCNVTSTPDTQYTITNDVHHFPGRLRPLTVPVSQTCGGFAACSRCTSWSPGMPVNMVKIDAGSSIGFRSATNANVIVRSTPPDHHRAEGDRGRPGLGSRPPRRIRTDDGHGDPRGEPGRGRARDRPEFSPGDHRAGRITRGT